MKWSGLLILVFAGALLAYSAPDLPAYGDPESPPSTHVSPRMIEEGYAETGAPNLVTGVLVDYRSFDTLFEAVVILVAGLGVALVLWPDHRRRDP
jgi:multicomponent Na+:H+ antiporter subunit B